MVRGTCFVGTNFDAHGRNNRQDLELAGYRGENQLPRAEANEKAREIAMERITSDPVRFARFALTTKLGELWSRERALYDSGSWKLGAGRKGSGDEPQGYVPRFRKP